MRTGAEPMSFRYGNTSCASPAPSNPMQKTGKLLTLYHSASVVWPASKRPPHSETRPETIIGTSSERSLQTLSIAYSAAFTFNASFTPSRSKISAPPSRSPRACSPKTSTSSWNPAELPVPTGPMQPATNLRSTTCPSFPVRQFRTASSYSASASQATAAPAFAITGTASGRTHSRCWCSCG